MLPHWRILLPLGPYFFADKVSRMGSEGVRRRAILGSFTKQLTTYGVKFKMTSGTFQGVKGL